MQWSRSGLLLLAGLLCQATRASAQFSYSEVSNQGALQSGDGTFYGAGQDNQGTCSFSENFANTNDLPWTTGAALTLALNDNQFDNGAACGLCVMYRGTGAGLGTTPIPSTWTLGFVNNRCPECSKGDLDQATSGDGRWNVEWYAVPCNVGSSSLVYSIVVSSYYWFSLVVSNTRYPITSVSAQIGGTWLPLKRSNNNQWAYYNTNGPWQAAFPMPIQITNCLGETITDSITGPAGNTGTVQFSESGAGGGVPGTTTGAVSPGASTTASPPTYPPAYPGSLASPPPAVLPTAPPPEVATPPPAAAPPIVVPQATLAADGFYIENYQQCGGVGGACNTNPYTAAPCEDIAWPRATCRSSNFGCVRYDTTLWTCIPSANATSSPPPVYTAPPTGAPPSQGVASTPSSSNLPTFTSPPEGSATFNTLRSQAPLQSLTGDSPPPVPASPPVVASPPVATFASSPPPATPTFGSSPPPASPPFGSSPPPASPPFGSSPPPASPPLQTPPSSPPPATPPSNPPPATPPSSSPPPPSTGSSVNSFTVADGGQCGGTTQCAPEGTPTDKVNCNNGPWAGASCSSGYSCQPDPGPLIWSCKSSSVATGGRRLLSS